MRSEQVRAEEASRAVRPLVGLVGLACRYPRRTLSICLVLVALSVYASSTRLQYRTERSDLVSTRKEYQQRWQRYLDEFGSDDDIVAVVKGDDRLRMEQALESLADAIKREPGLFDRLFYKVDLRDLHNRALLFLPIDQIKQIRENLSSMRLLLEFGPVGWRALTLISLLQEARHRAAVIKPGEALRPADEQFLGQLDSIARAASATLISSDNYRNPWTSLLAQPPQQKDILAEPQYFFSGDGSLAFLLVRPIKEAGSFTGAEKSVESMRAIVTRTHLSFPDLEMGLTGLPVLETDEMVAARNDTHLASILAIAGVSFLFLIVYRSIYYPMLTVGTLLIGTSWAMGWTTLTVGHLNILSATFAVMLIGMGDYGVLWVMRYERERRLGESVETALRHTAICVGAGTLTAALTAALAFFAATLADFQAVAELGWIAGSGILLCALACFTVLPAALKLADRRTVDGMLPINLQTQVTWLPSLARRPHMVVGATLVIAAAMGCFALRVRYDHNLLHLQARDLESVRWESTLVEHTAGASWHAQSYTPSPEEALALKARYEQLPEVSRVVEVASLVPFDQNQKLPLLRDIRDRLANLPERERTIPHVRPSSRGLKTELVCLLGQLQPLADACPQPLLAQLRGSLTSFFNKLNDMPGADLAEDRLQKLEESMTGDLARDLHHLRDVATALPIVLEDLPKPLRERYVGRTGKWLLQVFGKECLWDFEPLEHFASQIQSVDPDASGKPFATVEGLKAMKSGFQWAGVYAFCAIVFVLLFDFQNLRRTLIALSPMVLGLCLAIGLLGLLDLPLNPANMIALPLILGVGVDNGVHVLHDFLARKAEGQGRLSRAIGRGVLVKALTTMIGFGTLMISTQRGLAGLGFCLTLGVSCCMVMALVFLPALLTLWRDGRSGKNADDHEEEAIPRRLQILSFKGRSETVAARRPPA